MVLCPLCDESFNTVEMLRAHLRFFHNNPENLLCKHCDVFYRTVSSFVRHAPRHFNGQNVVNNQMRNNADNHNNDHENIDNENNNENNDNENNDNENNDVNNNVHNDEAIPDDLQSEHSDGSGALSDASDNAVPDVPALPNFLDNLCSNVQLFTAQLYAHPNTSRKLVDNILTGVQDLFCSPITVLKQAVFSLLSKCECNEHNFAELCSDIEQMFKMLADPLQLMATEHQRLSEFKEMGYYIPPESVEIGVGDNYDHRDQVEVLEYNPVSIQVVPLRKSLKAFLEIPQMFKEITDYMLTLENDENAKVSNVLQGTRWKVIKSRYQDKICIPINLDFDDVEPDNPLGSHHTDHKLGKLYAELPCLPPEIKSTLDNIIFVSTFESKHRKEFGNAIVFDAVIKELQFLEEEGIAIEVDGIVRQVYFCLLLIIGDNLGLNGILGFVESFQANFFCRLCTLHLNATQHTCVALENTLRTVQNYEVDLARNNYTLTGVKEECVWNILNSYDCLEAAHLDLMHDIHEGMLKFDISNILYYLVHVRDYLSLQTLRDRIDGFNFGPSEKGNKPPSSRISIESLRNVSVNLSATEWLCLGRYLGEMIGDLIPENNPIWRFYTLVREILEIVIAPAFMPGIPDYLRILIAEHHELNLRYFGLLKPKHHLMTHIPMVMERFGPLISVSAFLSERNHRKGKMYAKSCMSRRNFPLSVAVKYQLYYCERLIRKENALDLKLAMTKVTRCPVYSLTHFVAFSHMLQIDRNVVVNSPKTISLYGTLYSIGMCLITEVGDIFPKFGKIIHIIFSNRETTFVLKLLQTVSYRNHISAYEVEETNDWMCLPHSRCIDYTPLWRRLSIADGKTVISLRHFV